eukprot:2140470-Prymnesium_polylepis.1
MTVLLGVSSAPRRQDGQAKRVAPPPLRFFMLSGHLHAPPERHTGQQGCGAVSSRHPRWLLRRAQRRLRGHR